jgi:RNA polymerase subunit RPABC4/transcription elongation factor Spt4
MKFCPNCRRINEGWPDFCRFCGRSWGIRICRRGRHKNPASADFCGECQSADLSETASGGRIVNWIFGAANHAGALKRLTILVTPILLIAVVFADPDSFVGVIAGIAMLMYAWNLAVGLIPNGFKSILRWFIRTTTQSEDTRQRRRVSRR